jgi:signal transduction histidine kinase
MFMLCLALPLSSMLRESLLTRVEALRVAMGLVDRGEYVAHVVPLGGVELDELGRSFNQMVGRLRQHDEELRESRARIVTASDAARRRVERDLHDGAQQHLVTLRLRLGMIQKAAAGDAGVCALLDEARADIDHALDELRDLAHGIFPATLTNEGLVAALEVAAERCPLPVTVECEGDGARLAPDVEAAAYFCCVEAMQNASKHAGRAARVMARLDFAGGGLRFEVCDDGVGYDPATVAMHGGLQNMADRISAAGGALKVLSAPGAGTRVAGSIPHD